MAEMESVMQRLSTQTMRLKAQASKTEVGDQSLTVESLVLVSEALLKLGRDILFIKNQLAEGR